MGNLMTVEWPLGIPTLGDIFLFKDFCDPITPACLGVVIASAVYWPVISIISLVVSPLFKFIGLPVVLAGLANPSLYDPKTFEDNEYLKTIPWAKVIHIIFE